MCDFFLAGVLQNDIPNTYIHTFRKDLNNLGQLTERSD